MNEYVMCIYSASGNQPSLPDLPLPDREVPLALGRRTAGLAPELTTGIVCVAY